MKEFIENNRVTNPPLPNFITVKNREMFDKKEIPETFNNYFVNIGPNLAASISRKQNHTLELYSLRQFLPQYHQSYGLKTGK